MEENESPWRLSSALAFLMIETMNFSSENCPLFSCIITLYILIFLYFPNALKLSLSPILILTAVCLLFLLRLGAVQRLDTSNPEKNHNKESKRNGGTSFSEEVAVTNNWVECQTEAVPDPSAYRKFKESFVEWDVSAPLEVIHEGEEDDEEPNGKNPESNEKLKHPDPLPRYPSLSMYYPETDSDSSSDGEFPGGGREWEDICFKWEEKHSEGLMIEIALDEEEEEEESGLEMGLQIEEDDLIEIDISPVKDEKLLGEGVGFN